MKVTITSKNSGEYLIGEDGKVLAFDTVNEALCYLHEYNYTFDRVLWFDFNFEEIEEELKAKPCKCGSPYITIHKNTFSELYSVACNDCGQSGSYGYREIDAIKLWNEL
jgi:hypothetical protein